MSTRSRLATVSPIATWAAVWVATRVLMLVQVGFWNDAVGTNYQDIEFYSRWADTLADHHTMPAEDSWQYPPGAAFFLLLPRIATALADVAYQPSFVALMLLVDLAGLALLAGLARRSGRSAGVWAWLLAIPVLGANPITRFDLAPTVPAMAALVLLHQRAAWSGALAGVGASLKVWPILVLFGEWDRRRLAIATATAAGAVAATFLLAGILFGDQSGFFANQDARGLQLEAVGASPWYARWMVTGEPVPSKLSNGATEVGSGAGDAVAVALKWLGLLVLIAAALWWVARDRAIRRGRTDLADAALGRDFVFAVLLLQIVASRVLSPQFMIWAIGLAAIVLSSDGTRLRRPAWIVLAAVALTTGIHLAPANMVLRNVTLLAAAADAALAMWSVLREPSGSSGAPH